jgi:hypothetical protein
MTTEYEIVGKVDNLQNKYLFPASARVLFVFVIYNLGLLMPVYIFKVSEAVKVQLNVELALVFAIWSFFGGRWRRRGLRWFALGLGLFYVIAIIYKFYAGALLGLYQSEPNFFNDNSFVIGGITYFLEALNLSRWVYLASGTAVVILISLIFWGARTTIERVPASTLGKATRFSLISLGLIAILLGGFFPKRTADLKMPVSSVTAEITMNILRSFESRNDLKTFVRIDPTDTYDYTKYSLLDAPDVFFIFIESYGSVVYQRQHFTPPYLEMLDALERSLANDGWSAVSTLSEAPTWGGGSWMAYTSALFGTLVDQQSEYDALKEKYSVLEYPNIGRYFSSQGYEYVWVSPINRRFSEEREAKDKVFFGVDRWVLFDEFGYEGPLFGWGPAVPDQFTFGFIQEFVQQQKQPTFLVTLTQNSHYPWTPLPPVLDNWRDLEYLDMQDGVLSEAQKVRLSWVEYRQNYLQAVDNTLDTLGKFITSLDKENSVIVLVGDHQPPAVSRPEDGFGTMVHIISQDVDFLTNFHEYGFVDGLVLENLETTMRHEGLYSLFIRNIVRQYGSTPWVLPTYLPNGYK